MVHHCAKKKKTSTICVSNLHSLPWNITSMAHKSSNNVETNNIETKMNLQACIGKRCLHDSGETLPPRKAAMAAAAAAAILCQNIQEQKIRVFQRTKFRTDSCMTNVEKTPFELHRRSFKSENSVILKTNISSTMEDDCVQFVSTRMPAEQK